MAETRRSAWRAALASVLRSSACPSSLEPLGKSRAGLLLREELEREDDVGEDEDEEVHLLVALGAGEGLVLALGGFTRPAEEICI